MAKEKPSGFCNKITIDYYNDDGSSSITAIATPGKPIEVRGDNWKEAILNVMGDLRVKYPRVEKTFTATLDLFDTAEEWDEYKHEFKEYHSLDKEDQDYMILSEPYRVGHLFLKGIGNGG